MMTWRSWDMPRSGRVQGYSVFYTLLFHMHHIGIAQIRGLGPLPGTHIQGHITTHLVPSWHLV